MVWALTSLVVLISFNVWVTSLVYHRHLTHRSVELNKWVARALTLYFQGMAFAPPLTWVASHTAHQAHTDSAADPYSPKVHGFWRVLALTPLLVTQWRVRGGPQVVVKYARRVPDRRFYELCDRTWWCLTMMTSFAAGSFLLLGWAGVLLYLLQSCGFYLVMGWFNAAGHTWGDRPYLNSGTNRQGALWHVVNVCMAGELLHNYHHHAPRSANLGFQGEIDVGYLACRALACIRLAKIHDIRMPIQMAMADRRIIQPIHEVRSEQA